MARRARKISAFALLGLVLAATLFLLMRSILDHEITMDKNVDALVTRGLSEQVGAQADHLRAVLEGKLDQLAGLADYIAQAPEDGAAAQRLLRAAVELHGFAWVWRADAQGGAVDGYGGREDVSEMECYRRLMTGEGALCRWTAEGAILMGALVRADGEVIGALIGGYDASALGDAFFAEPGASCLIAADGIVLSAAPEEAFAGLIGQNLFAAYPMPAIERDVRAGESGVRLADAGGDAYYIAYTALGINDGYVLCVLSSEQVCGDYGFVDAAARALEIRFAAGACAIVALVVWFAWAKNRQLRAEKLRLEWSEERYRILAEDSKEVYLEYDIPGDRLRAGENFERFFGRPNAPDAGGFLDNAHPEDRRNLEKLLEELKGEGGETRHALVEYRMRVGGETSARYLWCRVRMSVLLDARGRRSRIIGKLTDISQERLNTERLEKRARTDGLTGLLNRAGLEEAIRARLEDGGAPCAVVICDIDDFKEFNDFYGHGVGDTVLVALADFLRGHFRGSDLVGRMGGDEFMAMMDGVNGRERLCQALKRLEQGLSRLRVGDLQVSLSVGAALFPEDGDGFEALYKCADIALYEAKRAGKGRFAVYEGQRDMRPPLEALDHMPFNTYVIDPDNCELLFVNANIRARFPGIRPGDKCYRAFMGADAPCRDCPARAFLNRKAESYNCTFHNTFLDEWARTTVSRISWPDGREPLLMTCRVLDAQPGEDA